MDTRVGELLSITNTLINTVINPAKTIITTEIAISYCFYDENSRGIQMKIRI
ncbi:MAG: hypothetical protein ACXAC6_08830 [Candidatus Hodarchaeales archaeon]|jgi:hypothetical protein